MNTQNLIATQIEKLSDLKLRKYILESKIKRANNFKRNLKFYSKIFNDLFSKLDTYQLMYILFNISGGKFETFIMQQI